VTHTTARPNSLGTEVS